MKSLQSLLENSRTPRVIGFDDAPFTREHGHASVSGIVTNGTRFEGMVYGRITVDGDDSTRVLSELLTHSKFGPQVHVVLTDGLTMGGLNVIDLQMLHRQVGVPCVAVMRRRPNLDAFRRALDHLPDGERRWETVQRAGAIHEREGFVFQGIGEAPAVVATVLKRITNQGHVPEALRLAHLIGSAVMTGESGKRA